MPILVVNGHRIYEQDEVGSDLSGYDFAVDKTGETEAEKIGAERIVLTGTELDGVNGYQEISGRKYLSNRLLEYQPTDIASANNLVLTNGRFFRLTGTTELQTINNNGWTGGSWILLEIKSGTIVKHNASDYGLGNYNGILLACQNDFTSSQDLILHLVWDRVSRKWKEVGGTTIAAITERPWYTALKVEAPCYDITTEAYLHANTENEFSGMIFTNEGTATVTTYPDFILIGAGTVFGLKNADESIEFPCCESSVDELFVHDVESGNSYILTGAKTVTSQDVYFKAQENGVQEVTLTNSNILIVAYKNNGNAIYT